MRLQTLKVSHKMLMSYFYESRSFIKRHREIFTTIKEDNLDFDHILPQFQRKIAFSSLWPPRFKSLQKTVSFSLCIHIGHKALKNVPRLQDCVRLTTTFGEFVFGMFMWIFQVMAHNCFGSPSLLYVVCRHVF